MEQRTRQQKVLSSYINHLVLYGYDQGIWHSLIVHTVLLTILALLSDSPVINKPIAINISFSSVEEIEEIREIGIVAVPSVEEIQRAVDSSASDSRKETDDIVATPERPAISDINNPIKDDHKPISTFTNNISTSDLLSYTEQKDDSNVSENSDSSKNANTFNITNIIASIEKGVAHNNNALSANEGIGSGIENRLSSYGAKTGDVQISLAWNTIDDIDLHVKFTPGNGLVDNIDWTNRIGQLSGGMLDIDMNANSAAISQTPVENIFWPPGSSPQGSFAVYVHFFRSWTGNTKVPVTVRIKNGIKVDTFQIMAQLYSNPQIVKQFTYPGNKKFKF